MTEPVKVPQRLIDRLARDVSTGATLCESSGSRVFAMRRAVVELLSGAGVSRRSMRDPPSDTASLPDYLLYLSALTWTNIMLVLLTPDDTQLVQPSARVHPTATARIVLVQTDPADLHSFRYVQELNPTTRGPTLTRRLDE